MQRSGVVRVSVIIGSLVVMLMAPVLASSVEPVGPAAEGGGLRGLTRELQPNAAQAKAATSLRQVESLGAPRDLQSSHDVHPVALPAEDAMTVSIDCDDRACVISSGLVVQVVAAAPRVPQRR